MHRAVIRALVAALIVNLVVLVTVLATASLNDRASCKRSAETRRALVALRNYATTATKGQRKPRTVGGHRVRVSPAELKAAREFQAKAKRAVVKRNTCTGLFP